MYNYNHDVLSDAETHDLVIQAQTGDETAIEKLVESNVRLVNFSARKYFHPGYDLEDFIQMGMVAMMKAIRDFDATKEVKFSTYIVTKVDGEIQTWLRDHSHTVKIPRDVSVAMRKIHTKNLVHKSIEEIAAKLRITDIECIETALTIIHKPLLSMDKLLEGDKKDMIIDIEGDVNTNWLLSIELRELLKKLDERSQKVITLKYWHELVNRDIAPILGVSNAQISRIERAALAKLKEEMETDKLIHS